MVYWQNKKSSIGSIYQKWQLFCKTIFDKKLDVKVIDDGSLAEYCAREYSDEFSDWQSLWDSELDKLGVYDEINSHVEHKISQFLDEYFDYNKNFNGVLKKIGYDESTETPFFI